jgi:hypothetical protein
MYTTSSDALVSYYARVVITALKSFIVDSIFGFVISFSNNLIHFLCITWGCPLTFIVCVWSKTNQSEKYFENNKKIPEIAFLAFFRTGGGKVLLHFVDAKWL